MYVNIPYMKLPYGYTNIHRPQGDSRWHCPPFEGSIFFARFCHWEVFVGPFQEGSSFVKLSNLHYTLLMGQGYTVIHPSSGDASLFQHADAMEVCKFIDTVLVDSNWRIYTVNILWFVLNPKLMYFFHSFQRATCTCLYHIRTCVTTLDDI